ncbi:MAG: hypothetical protein A2Y07_08135 [Planctomycetes bacterium GWF2_50_10]|nr:MAG: hypothetical protein A2Y07_08135 [Planctomycetes bacterium GWF2_50_10]
MKSLCLLLLICLFGTVSKAVDVHHYYDFTNTHADWLWTTAGNWHIATSDVINFPVTDPNAVPAIDEDVVVMNNPADQNYSCVIPAGASATAHMVWVGGPAAFGNMTINGHLTTGEHGLRFGLRAPTEGCNLVVNAGAVADINENASTELTIGGLAPSIMIMKGGVVNAGSFYVDRMGNNTGKVCVAQLEGGTLTCGPMAVGPTGQIDLNGGTLVSTDSVSIYRELGVPYLADDGTTMIYPPVRIKANNGTGFYDVNNPSNGAIELVDDFFAGTITVRAKSVVKKAGSPSPANGATGVSANSNLRWLYHSSATSHNVYFGTSASEVADATVPTVTISSPNFGLAQYIPGGLPLERTYYWRVDEVVPGDLNSPYKGDVWSFTTPDAVYDLTGNGVVNYDDLAKFLSHWLQSN